MKIIKLPRKNLNEAVDILRKGGVVICPTDTVYGFLADAAKKQAVEKIFKIKKRAKSKPLAVFVKDFKMARGLAEINAGQEKILKRYWPGKFTFVLKLKKQIDIRCLSVLVIGRGDTIALRIPKYKFLNDLLKKINKPLAQTSVNISGQPPLTKIDDILKFCEKCGRPDLPQLIINGGNLPKIKPSAIMDLTRDKIKILRL